MLINLTRIIIKTTILTILFQVTSELLPDLLLNVSLVCYKQLIFHYILIAPLGQSE